MTIPRGTAPKVEQALSAQFPIDAETQAIGGPQVSGWPVSTADWKSPLSAALLAGWLCVPPRFDGVVHIGKVSHVAYVEALV